MPPEPVLQAREATGRGDLLAPVGQHLAAQGGEPHPFGEALAIHLTPQHPQLDQPDQQVFGALRPKVPVAELMPVGVCADLAAAAGLKIELLIEAQPEWQAAQGLTGPLQGSPALLAVLLLTHKLVVTAAIVLPSRSES